MCCIFQSICPGYVQTGLFKSMGTKSEAFKALPGLKPENISQALIYILSTPIDVNVSIITLNKYPKKKFKKNKKYCFTRLIKLIIKVQAKQDF